MTTDYQKQANDFAKKHGIKLTIGEPEYGTIPHLGDNEYRYIFPCKLSRQGKSYSFKFGQSIAAGAEEPTMYDILACLEKNDPDSFEYFCDEFGYDTDSRHAEKVYKAVTREYKAVNRLFSDIIEELYEIQ